MTLIGNTGSKFILLNPTPLKVPKIENILNLFSRNLSEVYEINYRKLYSLAMPGHWSGDLDSTSYYFGLEWSNQGIKKRVINKTKLQYHDKFLYWSDIKQPILYSYLPNNLVELEYIVNSETDTVTSQLKKRFTPPHPRDSTKISMKAYFALNQTMLQFLMTYVIYNYDLNL